jgi:hypothetical protein
MAARVIVRALRVAMGRDLDVWQDKPSGALSWQERVQRAEDGCRQDAEAHYWRTMGRWSALACDKTYVQKAYADLAAYQAREPDAQFTHEQAVVLVIRAEDLSRTAHDVRGTCPGDVPPDVRPDVPSDVRPEVRQCPPGHVRGRNLTVVGGPS